ncbi:hypothetical protein [Synechococcus sp. LTW-R]|uniref:hypothetical protein n=1 Tax=Synechococcus sp. LTW-R TaxID=2751170 RepID=UPI001625F086|nr:hypothetical protein [Synechococcus sp. LTW-R]QNG28977.1 hypothetical protein H0O22_09520 [Synechococcus sp. LTW-R]
MIRLRGETWDKTLYLLLVGVYAVLAIASIFSGITSWDEETDYLGIRTQLAHAVELIRGHDANYKDIHSNLEYYGAASLFPAWLFWFLQQSLLIGRLSLSKALFDPSAEHQLTGFFATSHLLLAGEFVFLSWLAVKIARCIGLRRAWIPGCLVLFHPSLIGHSFINPKDIPFALFYTGYTYTLVKRWSSGRYYYFFLSLLSAALLINQKFVAVAAVVVSEILLLVIQRPVVRDLRRSIFLPVLALMFALVLQPASWGLNPFTYLSEAFHTFANHEWGGCMSYSGTCIGVNHPDWFTLLYIWNWLIIKVPLLWLILISLQAFVWLNHFKSLATVLNSPWPLVISQSALIPVMAVVRNSNLYDADRHLLFIYPSLAIVAARGLQTIWNLGLSERLRLASFSFISLLSLILFVDVLSLNPYQSAYLNETSRFSHTHTTTSLDYWGVSSKELIRNSQIYGSLPPSPALKQGVWISPFWIGFRQLDGMALADDSLPSPLFQLRDVTSFTSHQTRPCVFDAEVKRSLLFVKPLTMSKLYLCED